MVLEVSATAGRKGNKRAVTGKEEVKVSSLGDDKILYTELLKTPP